MVIYRSIGRIYIYISFHGEKLAASRVGHDRFRQLDEEGRRLFAMQAGYSLKNYGPAWTSYLANDAFYTIFSITAPEPLASL